MNRLIRSSRKAGGRSQHVEHVLAGIDRGVAANAIDHLGQAGENLDARLGQLPAHEARKPAADDAGDDREDQVEDADVFMVGRIDPPLPTGGSSVCGIGMSCFSVCHVLTF